MTLAELDTTVQDLRIESRAGGFKKTLAHVVTALGAIPDLPHGAYTPEDMVRLRELAEETVEAIERRIDTGGDGQDVQQHFAGSVYEVRRRMEMIETWFAHVTS